MLETFSCVNQIDPSGAAPSAALVHPGPSKANARVDGSLSMLAPRFGGQAYGQNEMAPLPVSMRPIPPFTPVKKCGIVLNEMLPSFPTTMPAAMPGTLQVFHVPTGSSVSNRPIQLCFFGSMEGSAALDHWSCTLK